MSRTLGFKNSSNVYALANSDGSYDSEYPLGDKPAAGFNISNVTGTVSEGSSITVAGAGFGTKSTAAPQYFSDFSGDTVGDTAIDAGLTNLDGSVPAEWPVIANDRSVSGSQCLKLIYPTDEKNLFPKIGITSAGQQKGFISQWMYWTRTAGSGGEPLIFKLARMGCNSQYSGQPSFRQTVRPSDAGVITGDGDAGVRRENSSLISLTNAFNPGPNADQWNKLVYYFDLGSVGGSDGEIKIWLNDNTTPWMQDSGLDIRTTSILMTWLMTVFDGIDSYNDDDNFTNSYSQWVDNIYIDDTQQRVIIGDGSTLGACTKTYEQPLTAWADTSITLDLNLSDFVSTDTIYFFVIDVDGNVTNSFSKVVV